MATDQGTETSTSSQDLFKRQTQAGTVVEGTRQPELSDEEKANLINLHAEKAGIQENITPPEIVELQKEAANAGVGGNPPLTPEKSAKLRAYYESVSKKSGH